MPASIFANLGDSVSTHHYFPIKDFLSKDQASLERRIKLEQNYIKSQRKNLKAEINRFTSSEFSHLIAAISKANSLNSAAVYDKYGLAVGYFDKKNKLPLFFKLDKVEKILSAKKNMEFADYSSESYSVTRTIKASKLEKDEILGFSVLTFSKKLFYTPTTGRP